MVGQHIVYINMTKIIDNNMTLFILTSDIALQLTIPVRIKSFTKYTKMLKYGKFYLQKTAGDGARTHDVQLGKLMLSIFL
jgi:hypothetical protein